MDDILKQFIEIGFSDSIQIVELQTKIGELIQTNAEQFQFIIILIELLGGKVSIPLSPYKDWSKKTLVRYYDNETMSDVFEIK